MKVLLLLALAAVGVSLGGCAARPDYSHYDWHARGGMVDEEDRSLAAARFEILRDGKSRRIAADEPLTPPGALPSRANQVIIDPTDRVARTPRRTATVASIETRTER